MSSAKKRRSRKVAPPIATVKAALSRLMRNKLNAKGAISFHKGSTFNSRDWMFKVTGKAGRRHREGRSFRFTGKHKPSGARYSIVYHDYRGWSGYDVKRLK